MCFSDASLPFCLSLFVQLFTQLYFSRDDACVFDCMRSERVKMKNWKSNKYVMHACNIVFTVEKLLLGLEMSFPAIPDFSCLWFFIFLLRWLVHQRALFLLSKAYNLFYFFIENLVIHETIAGQKQEQFYYVVKLHMDAFKWLVSIAHNAHFMQYTERKKIKFYCSLFCNDFMEQKKLINWVYINFKADI